MFMMLDCETNGLQGQTFAVAFAMFDINGPKSIEDWRYCPYDLTDQWCKDNLPKFDDKKYELKNPQELINWFNEAYKFHGYPTIVSDHVFPCESNFLALCAKEVKRSFYPIIDMFGFVQTLEMFSSCDFKDTKKRLPTELPFHHPLCDCRQSIREYLYYVNLIKGKNIVQ
jgi:hypothetical protein